MESKTVQVTSKHVAGFYPNVVVATHYTDLSDEWANAIIDMAFQKLMRRMRYIELQRIVLEFTLVRDEYVVFFYGSDPGNCIAEYVSTLDLSHLPITNCMWCDRDFPTVESCEEHEAECSV